MLSRTQTTIGIILLLLAQNLFAGPGALFKIASTGSLVVPINITLCLNANGPLSCQSYNVTSSTLSILTTIPNHKYSNAGIKINTSGHIITQSNLQPCPLNSKGFCLFSVSNTSPAMVQIQFKSIYAYVVNTYGTVSICSVSQNGSSFSACMTTTAPDSTGNTALNYPDAIALNPTQTMAYIGNGSPLTGLNACPNGEVSIAICPINIDGSFATCTTACDPTFIYNTGLAFSPDGKYLYVSNYNVSTCGKPGQLPCGWVSICPVNPDGTLAPCSMSNGPNNETIDFGYAGFVGVQKASNGSTFLYTTANENQLTIAMCLISGGIISDCQATNYDLTTMNIQTPQGISFNLANTVAYVGNFGSYLAVCSVTNGIITFCSTYNDSSFNFDTNYTAIGLFMSSPTGYGYIPNNGFNTVSFCQISSTDGSLSNCIGKPGPDNSGVNTFNVPSAVAVRILS